MPWLLTSPDSSGCLKALATPSKARTARFPADAAARVSAKGSVSHYPLYAHAHRYPPRHHGSWVFAIFMLVAMTGITVAILPAEVNSWAYVAGAENQDIFNPVSYGQACSGGVGHGVGCHTVTEGYLSRSGAEWEPGATRPAVQCPRPALGLGGGRTLTSGDGSAIPTIVAGLFFDGVTLLLLYALVVIVRGTPSRRSPADVRARWRRSGRSPPNTSSRSRSPRKRRSSPCTPWAR